MSLVYPAPGVVGDELGGGVLESSSRSKVFVSPGFNSIANERSLYPSAMIVREMFGIRDKLNTGEGRRVEDPRKFLHLLRRIQYTNMCDGFVICASNCNRAVPGVILSRA